jgi:UDP-N-acetyl-D-galactosamine dehydrogenase
MVSLSIVGMGYVGLPLGLAFDAEGYDVVGYDTDSRRIESYKRGEDPTGEPGRHAVRQSDLTFTNNPKDIESSDYYIITVPTPFDDNGHPDLSHVKDAGRTVGEYLTTDSTVGLESTVYPGATREVLLPVLETASGKTAGEGFYLGYSPERIVPGNPDRNIGDIVKIVSGHDETALDRLSSIYDDIIDAGVYAVPTIETAEAAKCLENTQRDVNIALMNEFALGCHTTDLQMNARDVIDAASTKWNFHEYHPGIVGGHCIPIDPNYLIWQFDQYGFDSRVMRSARSINNSVARFISNVTIEALVERMHKLESESAAVRVTGGIDENRAVGEVQQGTLIDETSHLLSETEDDRPRLLVLGFAYKANTTDVRSPVLEETVDQIRDFVEVAGIDPHVPNERIRNGFDVPVQEEGSFADFDALLLSTSHDCFTSLDLGTVSSDMNEWPVLVDVTGTFDRKQATENGFIFREL